MVCVRFAEGEVLAMDVARGSESRSAWIRQLVMDGLVARRTFERLRQEPDPEAAATVAAAVKAPGGPVTVVPGDPPKVVVSGPPAAHHLPTCRCPLCVGVR